MTVNQLCLRLYRRHVATQKEDVPTKKKKKRDQLGKRLVLLTDIINTVFS
jgi:hypothetical protein